MKLLLTSGGLTNDSIKKALKKLVGKEIKIAFIPTAANVEEGNKDWLIRDLIGCMDMGSVDIVDISAVDKKIWLSRLKDANVIFVGGGNTAYLMNWVTKSGLDKEFLDLLKTRVYVGISAGSIILSETIQTSSDYLFKLYDDEVKDVPKGLGFVNFNVRPHLNSQYFPRVTDENLKKVFKNLDQDLYAIDDNSSIVFNDGKIEVVSEGKWIKYSNG
jgi:dipeptidase E